jgi:hypothetical protein
LSRWHDLRPARIMARRPRLFPWELNAITRDHWRFGGH